MVKPLVRETKVTELDFSSIPVNRREHKSILEAMIDTKKRYIALIDGQYSIGTMTPVWFGFNFANGWGAYGIGRQFDPPGTNGCSWQKVWRVDDANGLRNAEAILMGAGIDPVALASSLEMEYAETRRRYAIDHGLVYRRKPITEESPIEAWKYDREVPAMPGPYPNEYGEYDECDDDE